MNSSNSPSNAAEKPDIESGAQHKPAIAGGEGSGGPSSEFPAEAPTPKDFGQLESTELGVERGPEPLIDKPPGGWNSRHPHISHLANWSPSMFEGGTLQGAMEENWKILSNQQASVYLARLEPGGVREPHWHPSAWGLNDDVGIVASVSAISPGVLGVVFNTSPEAFRNLPHKLEWVTITRKSW